MRIVILADRIYPYDAGGAGKIAWRIAQGCQERGHEVQIISATPEASHQETRDGIPIHYLHSRYPERWRAWLSLYNPQTLPHVKRLLQQIQPDVVNVHNIHADLSYASIRAARKLGLPVVFFAHDLMSFAYSKVDYFIDEIDEKNDENIYGVRNPEDYRPPLGYHLRMMRLRYNPFRNFVIRHILQEYTDVRLAISEEHKAALEANYLPPFRVVYHGFDPAEYPPPNAEILENLRARFGLTGRRVIFFGGRLTLGKGARQLLEALNQVVLRLPNVTLLALSAAPLEKEWLAGLDNLRPEHICQGGWLSGSELIAAYHLADVVAVPSVYLDPIPTTVFEAMAAAKPLVVTCYGGSPEALREGETGFIINPFDTATFAERLTRLLSDAALAQKMGAAGQAYLEERFSFGQQINAVLRAYADAIAQNKTSA